MAIIHGIVPSWAVWHPASVLVRSARIWRLISDLRYSCLRMAALSSSYATLATCSGTQSIKDAVIVVIDGEHQNEQLRVALFQDFDAFDAVHARQPYVG